MAKARSLTGSSVALATIAIFVLVIWKNDADAVGTWLWWLALALLAGALVKVVSDLIQLISCSAGKS